MSGIEHTNEPNREPYMGKCDYCKRDHVIVRNGYDGFGEWVIVNCIDDNDCDNYVHNKEKNMNKCQCKTHAGAPCKNGATDQLEVVTDYNVARAIGRGTLATNDWDQLVISVCGSHRAKLLMAADGSVRLIDGLKPEVKPVPEQLTIKEEEQAAPTHEELNKCPKCNGEGKLSWTGVDNGRCWMCHGTGVCDTPETTAVVVFGSTPRDQVKAKVEWMRNWKGKGKIVRNKETRNWEIHRN